MPKDPRKNIDRYKIDGGQLNEFEFQKGQEELAAQQPQASANLIPGTPPEQTKISKAAKGTGTTKSKKAITSTKVAKSKKATKSTKATKAKRAAKAEAPKGASAKKLAARKAARK
jgi:hypothetical protein